MKFRLLTLGIAMAAASTHVTAGAPNFLDSRAFAMGGVGVASARPAAASFYNPAMLAVKQTSKSDGFGLILPSVAVVATDEDELIDEIDDFEDDFLTPFENSIETLKTDLGSAAVAEFNTRTDALDNKLNALNNDNAIVDIGAGLSVQVPGQTLGVGVFVSGNARVSATIGYNDSALLNQFRTDVNQAVTDGDPTIDLGYLEGDLQSNVRAIGAATSQVGVTFAHNFELGGRDIALGISPKMVDFRVYDYSADVENFEADDLKDTKKSDTAINFDLGMATYLDDDKRWLFGLSVLNVLKQDLKTDGRVIAGATPISVSGLTVELEPTTTAGVSYSGLNYVVAVDLELTESKAVYLEDDRQFVGIGAEYDLFETAQFRIGARHNLAGSSDPILTTGFGLTLLGASVELAAMGNSNTLGASFQVGSTF